jgi:hypothetical protein
MSPFPAMNYWSQPGIFNVLDPWVDVPMVGFTGLVANNSGKALQNTQVLLGIIQLAQAFTAQGNCPPNPYGATILFPGHTVVPQPVDNSGAATDFPAVYYFQIPAGQTYAVQVACNWPLRFLGTGNVTLELFVPAAGGIVGDLFSVATNTSQDADVQGTTFEDLQFSYPAISDATSLVPPPTAIHIAAISPQNTSGSDGGQNVRVVRCIFEDCPVGVWFEQSLQGSMLECTALFKKHAGVAVIVGAPANSDTPPGHKPAAKEVYIAGCTFRTNGPPGSTGIWIISSEHTRVTDTRKDAFTNGILIQPGFVFATGGYSVGLNVLRCSFSDVTVYAGQAPVGSNDVGQALTIAPASTEAQAAQLIFTNCSFEPGSAFDMTAPTNAQAGIQISQNGSTVETVRFVSCYSCRWPGPGLEIQGGSDIEVFGGMYAGNNLAPLVATQTYGIYTTQDSTSMAATGIRIVGVSCVGKYEYVTLANSVSSPKQSIGIYIDKGSQDVIIDSCDVRNNGTNGVLVNGSVGPVKDIYVRNCNATSYGSYSAAINISGVTANQATVQVTDCAGYNDQGTQLQTVPPTSATAFHNYSLANPYYGPISFIAWPGTGAATISEIDVNGNNTHLATGIFFVPVGQSGTVTWAPHGLSVISFVAVGA